ncbi:MAG: hypothetical protein U9Q84_03890 [Thermodesulfobacteriota bacterium]|nr:hypothetical protein [Thermodesulfobacteriota bacterium]
MGTRNAPAWEREQNNIKLAEKYIKKAIVLDPDSSKFRKTVSMILCKRSRNVKIGNWKFTTKLTKNRKSGKQTNKKGARSLVRT